jgi:hypothetical protein
VIFFGASGKSSRNEMEKNVLSGGIMAFVNKLNLIKLEIWIM